MYRNNYFLWLALALVPIIAVWIYFSGPQAIITSQDVGQQEQQPIDNKPSRYPRLEAHSRISEMTLDSIRYEWAPYYYRHPNPQKAIKAFEVLQNSADTPPPNTAQRHERPDLLLKFYPHFFAALFSRNPEELKKFINSSANYTGLMKENALAIIAETERYQPVTDITTHSLEYLPMEFMVTGDTNLIDRLVAKLDEIKQKGSSISPDEARLSSDIESVLCLLISAYSDAGSALEIAKAKASGATKTALNAVSDVYNRFFSQPAEMHLQKADLYIKQGNPNAAFNEFESSLNYVPDYTNVFNNAANLYEAQGDYTRASRALEKALQIQPNNASATYNMGRMAFAQRRYNDAIHWYSQSLIAKPDNYLRCHALARAYQESGDTANAVKYFHQYLQLVPNGEHAALVKSYLASVNATIPQNTSVLGALQGGQYDVLENRMATLLREKKKDEDGHSLLANAYDELANNPDAQYDMEKSLASFEGWVRNSPSSHFANAAAGVFYITYAWSARGKGYSGSVTEEGARLFHDRLLKAKAYLDRAYDLDPSDPFVPAASMKVVRGLGPNDGGIKQFIQDERAYFQKALNADPSEFRAYLSMLTFLMPKWGGSNEIMLAFARQTVAEAPKDSLAPLVLPLAHFEIFNGIYETEPDYFKRPGVWTELKPVFVELLNRFPKSKEIHNWYVRAAYLAGDAETARQEFKILQFSWHPDVWASYGAFYNTRKAVLGEP